MNVTPSTVALTSMILLLTACGAPATSSSTAGGKTQRAAIGSGQSCTTSLALTTASVGYTDTVQAVLKKSCVSCHSAKAIKPDLSTYDAAKAGAAASARAILAGSMPPPTSGITMSAADKASLAAWVAGGMLQTAAGSTSGTAASTPTSTKTPAATAPAPTSPSPSTPSSPEADSSQCTASATATPSPAAASASGTTTTTSKPSTATSSGTTTDASATNASGTNASGTSTDNASGTTTTTAAAAPTYATDIEPLMQTYCTGCHSGGTSPNLSTYASVKAAAQASLNSIKAGRMPKGNLKLTAAELNLFQTWTSGTKP